MDSINWHTFFFLLFSLVACAFSVAVVVSGNIVRMAFYLIIALGATAGLFFLAGASFVGAMQLMIYVGGTLVLLIFGVMLTAKQSFISMKTRAHEWVVAAIVGGALLAVLLQAAFTIDDWRGDPVYARPTGITGSPSRPNGQVIIRPKKDDTGHLGTQVVFKPADRESVDVKFDAKAKTLTFGYPEETTATDVAEALNSKFGDVFEATFPAGSNRNGQVTAADGTHLALRAPRGDTPPGSIGLAFLGFRSDQKEQHGYLLPFEIISVHLLVVLIGAAYLARAKKRVDPTTE